MTPLGWLGRKTSTQFSEQKCIDYIENDHLWSFFYITHSFLYPREMDRLYRKMTIYGHLSIYSIIICDIQTKMYRLYRKITVYVHFLYNLYFFVWIQHGCLANMFFALDPSNSVIKRLWYNLYICCLFSTEKLLFRNYECEHHGTYKVCTSLKEWSFSHIINISQKVFIMFCFSRKCFCVGTHNIHFLWGNKKNIHLGPVVQS